MRGNFVLTDCIKMAAVEMPECLDFLHFQDMLKKMRTLDDKIIYTLNTNLPTESFKDKQDCNVTCKELYDQLCVNYNQREKAIQRCIKYTSQKVQELKDKREIDNNDMNILKALRKEQGKLKLLRTELGVEEVIKDKTTKVYYERCRQFYIPPNLNI